MHDKKYLFGALVNLVTLLVGLMVGFVFGSRTVTVRAQSTPPIEEVAPVITAGSAAFGTVLAGRLAADEISIKGFDPLKFDQNLINLLGSKSLFFSSTELQSLINNSASDKILRMKQPQSAKPAPPAPEKKP